MWIKSVRFQAFGRFGRGLDLSFEEGLNVVLGPNECGKSTIMEGIIGILFGLKDRDAETACRPRGLHAGFGGDVEIVRDGVAYRIARDFESHRVSVTRDEAGQKTEIYQGEANPRGRTDDLLAYLDVVGEITGLRDRETARRSLFMSQGDLETEVDERVRHLLSGSQVGDYDQVVSRLEDRYAALTRENPWGRRRNQPRELEELAERIADLEERSDRSRRALVQGGQLSQELDNAAAELSANRAELEEKTQLFSNYSEFFEIDNERNDLEQRLRTLRAEKEKVKALVEDCQSAEAELWPRFECFRGTGPEFGESLRALSNLQRDVSAMESELAQREKELAATPWPRNLRRGLITGGIAAVVAFAAMAGAGEALVGVVAGLVLGILTFVAAYVRGKGREKARIRVEGQVVVLTEQVEKQRAELEELEASHRGVLGDRRLKEILEEFRDYREKVDLLSRYEQIRDSHRQAEEVEADYDFVFEKLKLIDAKARDLIAGAPYLAGIDADLDRAAETLERARREKEAAAARVQDLDGHISDLKLRQARREGSNLDDIESIEEELSELRTRRTRVQFLRDAMGTAIDVIRESIGDFQEGHVERLAGRAGDVMNRLTGERYSRIALDRNFVPLLTAASGEVFTPEQLSQGTRDQLHMALRLAISDEIHNGGGQPILMDDVLVNCDAVRLESVRDVLEDITVQGRQVLLFAHDEAYLAWGGNTVRLGDGTAGNGEAMAARAGNG